MERTPRMKFPKTHSEIDGLVFIAPLLTIDGLVRIGAALQSFWPMLRAALARFESTSCQNTWSWSVFRKVFAHQAGDPGTVKFSFRAYLWPSAGARSNLARVGVPPNWRHLSTKARKVSRAALASIPAAEGLFQHDRVCRVDQLEEPLVGG